MTKALPNAGIYAVGGSVRDSIVGETHTAPDDAAAPSSERRKQLDLDYLVTGMELSEIIERLQAFGSAELVGASFGVIKFTRNGVTVDLALPRREQSSGTHHCDFVVESAPDIPVEEDLARRDFRINMMARDIRSGAVVDPYGGRSDLEHGRLDV